MKTSCPGLVVRAGAAETRALSCAGALVQFLLDYPLGERRLRHALRLARRELGVRHASGRSSAFGASRDLSSVPERRRRDARAVSVRAARRAARRGRRRGVPRGRGRGAHALLEARHREARGVGGEAPRRSRRVRGRRRRRRGGGRRREIRGWRARRCRRSGSRRRGVAAPASARAPRVPGSSPPGGARPAVARRRGRRRRRRRRVADGVPRVAFGGEDERGVSQGARERYRPDGATRTSFTQTTSLETTFPRKTTTRTRRGAPRRRCSRTGTSGCSRRRRASSGATSPRTARRWRAETARGLLDGARAIRPRPDFARGGCARERRRPRAGRGRRRRPTRARASPSRR